MISVYQLSPSRFERPGSLLIGHKVEPTLLDDGLFTPSPSGMTSRSFLGWIASHPLSCSWRTGARPRDHSQALAAAWHAPQAITDDREAFAVVGAGRARDAASEGIPASVMAKATMGRGRPVSGTLKAIAPARLHVGPAHAGAGAKDKGHRLVLCDLRRAYNHGRGRGVRSDGGRHDREPSSEA